LDELDMWDEWGRRKINGRNWGGGGTERKTDWEM
jgi:hypothetical protein